MKRTHLLATLAMLLIASAMQAQTINDYMALAQKGDPEAMYQVGYCYWKGIGVAPDADEADKWMEKAAKKGHLDAMHYAGMWINEKYLKKAADLGHIQSCTEYAVYIIAQKGQNVKAFNKYCHYFQYAIDHGTDKQKYNAACQQASTYLQVMNHDGNAQTLFRYYKIAVSYATDNYERGKRLEALERMLDLFGN